MAWLAGYARNIYRRNVGVQPSLTIPSRFFSSKCSQEVGELCFTVTFFLCGLSVFLVPHVLPKSNFSPLTLFWSELALKLLIKSKFGPSYQFNVGSLVFDSFFLHLYRKGIPYGVNFHIYIYMPTKMYMDTRSKRLKNYIKVAENEREKAFPLDKKR
jgi:hypothetical protein